MYPIFDLRWNSCGPIAEPGPVWTRVSQYRTGVGLVYPSTSQVWTVYPSIEKGLDSCILVRARFGPCILVRSQVWTVYPSIEKGLDSCILVRARFGPCILVSRRAWTRAS